MATERLQHSRLVTSERDDVNVENDPVVRSRKLGAAALDGYIVMPEAINVNEAIRSRLEGQVIGQPAAIEAIVEAMDRRGARLERDSRPIASFAFLGPTGVGKTEAAKAIASALALEGEEPNLIHINCTEYKQRHSVSRLLGAPPSYVGFGEKTVLNEENVKNNSVILFDEIEKASPDLYDVIMQVLDEGSLQTGDGTKLSFRDSVVVMTSNLGSDRITEHMKGNGLGFEFGGSEPDISKIEESANASFIREFRPEFINRITKQVVFHPLGKDSLGRILDIKLGECNDEYESYDECFSVSLSDKVREYIVEKSYDERHRGGRAVVGSFDSSVVSLIGRYRGSGMIEHGSQIKVFHRDEVGSEVQNPDMPEFIFASRRSSLLIEENYRKRQAREYREFQYALREMEEKSSGEPK